MNTQQATTTPLLPHLDDQLFLTDAGLETFLIFDRDIELPEFASFPLLGEAAGIEELRDYYASFIELAAARGLGFVLESPTWRANPRWGAKVGYDADALAAANRRAIALMKELREAAPPGAGPIVISGNVGPLDDGYAPGEMLTTEAAQELHAAQVSTFAEAGVDLTSAVTMTYVEEATGFARAARAAGLTAVVSFTVETDGRLITGQSLGEAVEQVDADPGTEVAYFMVNCAHPTHFADELRAGGAWVQRIRGLRANASTMSHAELDEATELDAGDPADLGARYAELRQQFPQLNVLGGCCGTDLRHVAEIAERVQAGNDH